MIAGALALLTLFLHASTGWRYGYFRDELYFIACAQHLAWGYVDQPPLVALAAWLSAPFGYAPLALRALPMLAAALTVALAVRLVRELGGGRFAQFLGGIAVALTPAYLLLGNTLTTTSFEPLSWTLTAYALLRIVRGGGRWWWLALALAVAFGGYGKYSIALLVVALAVGLLATGRQRVLATPMLPLAALLALALLAPNLLWQAAHGWPIFTVLHGDAAHRPALESGVALEYRNLAVNALAFAAEQVLYTGPFGALIWAIGLIAPFRVAALRDTRPLSVAYVALVAMALLLGGKGYYIVGIYATLLAVGAVALERAARLWRASIAGGVVALGLLALPLALPVLPVDGLIAYTRTLGLTGRGGTPAHLIQPLFAEEFGWRTLARDVARVYASLPPGERAQTTIYADTYGDAGALDFYGPRHGLPPAVSTQNSYYGWGPGPRAGRTLIAIGATRIARLKRYYRCRLVATSDAPLKWIVEGPAPIYLCRHPIAPLRAIWPHLRWYGA